MRLNDSLYNVRSALPKAAVVVLTVTSTGCSSYTLTPITAAEAKSDFPSGTSYKVSPPGAFLKRSWSTGAVGSGQPSLALTRYNLKKFPALHEVPAGTKVRIEKFVRFDQRGLYDCGFDGWRFAIGHILDDELRGKSFLIDSIDLTQDPESCLLVRE